MSRINTNISALTAQVNLANSNSQLQVTLTRLSTGLRINSAADDPAGMIAATDLGSNIKSSQQAIANSQSASQMISTADAALSQISSLLTTINGLVTQAANTSAMSSSQIAANQLQIDSSLSAINSIAQTTTFQGQNLLNGNLAFKVAAGTNYSKIQNLNVSQVNFGTATTVPVDINVTSLAKQALIGATVNDGATTNSSATGTVTFASTGGSITVTAPSTGLGANGVRIAFQENSTITAGTASAAYDSTTQTLNVTVSDKGVTSAATIANAINNDTTFTATASSALATIGYTATTDKAVNATTTVSTAGGGAMNITSLIPGAGGTGKTVTFVEGDASSGPTVAVNATTGNLTVTVNDTNHHTGAGSNGVTTLASIAAAINNYTNSNGQNVFSANVTNGGSFNTAVDPTTRMAVDGFSAVPNAKVDSATVVTGLAAHTITFGGLGAAANGARIEIDQVTGNDTLTAAAWDPTANGGKGKLTLTLATLGGASGDGQYVTSDLTALVAAVGGGNVFTGVTAGASFDANTDLSPAQPMIGNVGAAAGTDGTLVDDRVSNLAGGVGAGGSLSGGTGTSGLAAALTLQVGGNAGGQLFSFIAGTTATQIATALNQASDGTGVQATTIGDRLIFNSTDYGSAANVSVKVVNEGTGGSFGSSLSAANASGTDIGATVNGVAATGLANTVSLNTPSLAFSASLNPTQVVVGDHVKFNVTGGGALFQLGPQVTSAQQANLGIQSVDTSTLGGTVGRLYELGTGNDASLTNNPTKAAQIVQAALSNITSLRGQLGAFQTATINTNISTLTGTVTNLTAAQSSIQDADFAAESANLSREQILVQSGTTVAGIAVSTPANVLSLLQKAGQV
jgi:flagellin